MIRRLLGTTTLLLGLSGIATGQVPVSEAQQMQVLVFQTMLVTQEQALQSCLQFKPEAECASLRQSVTNARQAHQQACRTSQLPRGKAGCP